MKLERYEKSFYAVFWNHSKIYQLTMPFGTEETNTSDTKDDTDNLIVLGSNRKVRCIGQIWSSKNPIETTGTSKYSIIP